MPLKLSEPTRKFFFKCAASKAKLKVEIGPFIMGNCVVSDPVEKAEILQTQFVSVFSTPLADIAAREALLEQPGPRCLEDLSFTAEDIRKSILKLSSGSTGGPDGVPAVLLKECVDELKYPIYLMWRASLSSSHVPRGLKVGIICPIYKSGNRSEPQNYRPITLTSHLIKVYERVLVDSLTCYLESLALFNERQNGF